MREIGRIGNNPKPCHMKKIHNVGNVESGREMELRGNVMDFFKLFKVSGEGLWGGICGEAWGLRLLLLFRWV